MRRVHRFALVLILAWAGVIPLSGIPAVAQGEVAKRLTGTWRLVNVTDSAGKPIRGANPTGYIHYDPSGIMSVQIMPDWERPKFSTAKSTPDQAKAAIDLYTAYFGNWIVDEQTSTVTHRRAGNINPGDMGDFVRQVEFRDDLLILRSEKNNLIIWRRVK